jgi:DNA-binding NarL/FixJ family response regulator
MVKMSDSIKAKIIIADSQFLIVESLAGMINNSDRYTLHAITGTKHELYSVLETVDQALLITDPLLMDYNGMDDLIKVRQKYPQISILILTQSITKIEFVELRKAGITSVIFKTTGREELFAAIEATLKGRKYYTPDLLDLVVDRNENLSFEEESKSLTLSEIEIVKMIANGYTTKEIANQRHVSFHTVNTHRKNIFRKLGVTNASELIMQAIKSGWIDNIEYYI